MNILGVGPGELLMIAILTLVVVGPERLPLLARRAGQLLVSARNWIQASPDAQMVLRMRRELEEELTTLRSSLAEMQQARDEMLKQVNKTVEEEVVSPMKQAVEAVEQAAEAVEQAVEQAQTVPRGTSRAAIVNGPSDTSGDLSAPASDELVTDQPPLAIAEVAPVAAPASEPVQTIAPPGMAAIEQVHRQLEALAADMAALRAALRQRGLIEE